MNQNKLVAPLFKCRHCEKTFAHITSRRRHEQSSHKIEIKNCFKFKCDKCHSEFLAKKKLIEHIVEKHPDMKAKEVLNFASVEEFKAWKEIMEHSTASFYVLSKTHVTLTSDVKLFSCHRSGNYRMNKGKKDVRHMKLGGSKKIGSICPAGITLYIDKQTSDIRAIFYPTHMGHTFQVGILPLPKSEKDRIAKQLHDGVSTTLILSSIAQRASPTERLAVTTSQDVRNIAVSYGIGKDIIRSQNDMTSVDDWVRQMISGQDNPIILYKQPGEVLENCPTLEERDFVLGFMNDPQIKIFQLYGSEVISIESTHGTNKYDIQLTSIIVKDDNREAFPVAFLWSNRQHEVVFKYFFQECKKKIGPLTVNVFMSDDYPAFFTAWSEVFGSPKYHLLCDWYVKRAWRKHLQSGPTMIKNVERRQEVLNLLTTMSNETDKHTFHSLLNIVVTNLMAVPDSANFGAYFSMNYANRPNQWAACYRLGANIDKNITERWHKDLTYNSDLKGKCGGRLDKAIHSLMKSLKTKLVGRLSSIERGKLTKKIIAIRNSHKEGEQISNNTLIVAQENRWIVTCTQLGETYIIKQMPLIPSHSCNLKCDMCRICLHQLTCSCPNSSVNYNMCKHIHALCLNGHVQRFNSTAVGSSQGNIEKEAITKSGVVLSSQKSNTLKEKALSAGRQLLEEIESFENNEQYEEFIKMSAVVKAKCKALAAASSLTSGTNRNSVFKKIEGQRKFPQKKKVMLDHQYCIITR